MVTIIEGMYPAQFLTAINNNFDRINYFGSTLTNLVGTEQGVDIINLINTNFSESKTNSPVNVDAVSVSIGMKNFAARLNSNFNSRKISVDRPTLTIRFDDGFVSVLTWLTLLDSLNITATAAILTGEVGEVGYVTWGNIATLKAAGWEIISHGVFTEDNYTDLTNQQVLDKLLIAKNALIAQGYDADFFGAHNLSYRKVGLPNLAMQVYKMNETLVLLDDAKSANPVDLYLNSIDVISGDGNTFVAYTFLTGEGMNLFKGILDSYKNSNQWFILLLHGYSAGLAAGLTEFVNYAKSLGISIRNSREVYDSLVAY